MELAPRCPELYQCSIKFIYKIHRIREFMAASESLIQCSCFEEHRGKELRKADLTRTKIGAAALSITSKEVEISPNVQ